MRSPGVETMTSDLMCEKLRDRLIAKELSERGRPRNPESERAAARTLEQMYLSCFGDYYQALAQMPDYLSRDRIGRMATIDLSQLNESFTNVYSNEKLSAYVDSLDAGIEAVLPAWNTGIIRPAFKAVPPDGIDGSSIYFNILDVDAGKNELRVFLQYYCLTNIPPYWFMVCEGVVTIGLARRCGMPAPIVGLDPDYENALTRLYTKVPPSALGWSSHERRFWEDSMLQWAVDQDALTADGPILVRTAGRFFGNAILSNYVRNTFTPKKSPVKVVPKHPAHPASAQAVEYGAGNTGIVRFVPAKPDPAPVPRNA